MCLTICDSLAQSTAARMGARAHGMGNASGCLSDAWALMHNPAGIAGNDAFSAAVSFHVTPLAPHFNRMAAVFTLPVTSGVAGGGVFRFGDDLYNEHILSLGYANTFGLASLALKVNYIQYQAAGLGTRRALTVGFGGIASLTPKLLFGAYMGNLNQPVINDQTGERVPARMTAGLACKPSEKVIVTAEIDKDLAYAPTFRSGFEYRVFSKVAFRTGFNLNPARGFLGAGFRTSRLNLDYSIQFYDPVSPGHQATAIYQPGKK